MCSTFDASERPLSLSNIIEKINVEFVEDHLDIKCCRFGYPRVGGWS